MSSSTLKSVRKLLRVLNEDEHRVLTIYLKAFHNRGEGTITKSMLLYQLLRDEKKQAELSEREIMWSIYKESSTASFNRLVLRFRDKILESLLFDMNIMREGAYSDRVKAQNEIRKRISCAQILLVRGEREIAMFLIASSIEKGKQFELYDELQTALILLYKTQSLTKGMSFAQKYLDEFKHFEYCRHCLIEAEQAYHEIVVKDDFKTNNNNSKDVLVERRVNEIAKYYKATNSASIAFYLYYLKSYLASKKEDYTKARRSIQELILALERKPAIYSKTRMGLAKASLSEIFLFLRQFEDSIDEGQKALALMKPDSLGAKNTSENLFYAFFYLKKYDEAYTIAQALDKSEAESVGTFRKGKWLILQASALFMLQEYSTAHLLLSLLNPADADTSGWNIGARVISIMTCIELEYTDEASLKIQNLISFARSLEKNQLLPRMNLIISLFRELEKKYFDFKAVYTSERELIEKLETSATYHWQIKSPELMVFNQWFTAKTFKQPFIQQIPTRRLEIAKSKLDNT